MASTPALRTKPLRLVLTVAWGLAAAAWGQSGANVPHVGYVYPAGGRQGATVQVTIGGQYLRGVSQACVSGEDIATTVVQYYRPVRSPDRDQRQELLQLLREVRDRRQAEAEGQVLPPPTPTPTPPPPPTPAPAGTTMTAQVKYVQPFEHPVLHDLPNKSPRELENVAGVLLTDYQKRQPNTQIGEMVLVELRIAPGAAPGDREIRLRTPFGLSNPIRFQVGQLPEVLEMERPPRNAPSLAVEDETVEPPATLNGQIFPGDIDTFRLHARKGQHLVMQAAARRLIPFLADAVPGWFQPTLALYDADGQQLAYNDDYRFDPDPVLEYDVPADGEYRLEIRDAIYRGREDFVYRINVGEIPFVTQAFPLGGKEGAKVDAAIGGWNLAQSQLPLDTAPGGATVRLAIARQGGLLANGVRYAVDTLPEANETEPNDTPAQAQSVALPLTVNGRIGRPGDADAYRFAGHAGDEVVAEVLARRLGSPLDSVLRLTDAAGKVVAWNDDNVRKEGYLFKEEETLTHDADSYVRTKLPADGDYYAQVTDAQAAGGEAYAYRLRLGPPRPDFSLRATPSSLNLVPGGATPIAVYALRQDGFDGEIEIALKDAPDGFSLSGAKIPAGRDSVRMTIAAPRQPVQVPFVLQLEGRAEIAGNQVTRAVEPAEDMMQAFLYRHLAPAQEFLADVPRTRYGMPPFDLAGPIRVPEGGSAEVVLHATRYPQLENLRLQLSDPPAGLKLGDVTVIQDGLSFQLTAAADSKTLKAGYCDNLLVEVYSEQPPRPGQAPAVAQRQRSPLGVMPAVAFEIVKP